MLDLSSRRLKACKIESLLNLRRRPRPVRILEIGTGCGGIAHYFATHPEIPCRVCAVDVVDQLQVREGFDFALVQDTRLPFPDERFDVVISNHVLEHVGPLEAQKHHLAEIRRVMHRRGVGYLALPSRWMVMEPHYRLPFLSWLPERLRHAYVRLCGRADHYDCRPLAPGVVERLIREAGLRPISLGTMAFRETIRLEGPAGFLARLIAGFPDRIVSRLERLMPTLIYRLERAA
ncbi:MAG: methyltransferase domain-containing protein [Desulfobacterales bacterium]